MKQSNRSATKITTGSQTNIPKAPHKTAKKLFNQKKILT